MPAKTVLVIDDIEENADIIKIKLTSVGYRVLVAEDGETGLRLAAENLPDLVLCDIMLPRMDGWEVLSRLRRDERTAAIPVVFMTAYSAIQIASERRVALEKGAVDYLKKPFDLAEMLAVVRRHLGETAGEA